jgi:hypothetical protein
MQDTIVTIYCLCDDLLKGMQHRDDVQTRFSTAQVMTVPLVAASFFGGNNALARRFLHCHGYFSSTLSASRFNRRLHAISPNLWRTLFGLLGQVFTSLNQEQVYVADSLPIPVCDNMRIRRCRLYPPAGLRNTATDKMRGYIASKRRYFYGLRVHLLVTGRGEPVEFILAQGGEADLANFRKFELDLDSGSRIYADKSYQDSQEETFLQEVAQLEFWPQKYSNAKVPRPAWISFLADPLRKRIETSFCQITSLFPRHLKAVTAKGFELKIVCFLLAFSIYCLQK